jgi:hypothetical protein
VYRSENYGGANGGCSGCNIAGSSRASSYSADCGCANCSGSIRSSAGSRHASSGNPAHSSATCGAVPWHSGCERISPYASTSFACDIGTGGAIGICTYSDTDRSENSAIRFSATAAVRRSGIVPNASHAARIRADYVVWGIARRIWSDSRAGYAPTDGSIDKSKASRDILCNEKHRRSFDGHAKFSD